MLARVDQVVYLFDLAAFEVGYVDHVEYDGPAVDLLEDIPHDLATIKLNHVICELHCLAWYGLCPLFRRVVFQKSSLGLEIMAPVADEALIGLALDQLLRLLEI